MELLLLPGIRPNMSIQTDPVHLGAHEVFESAPHTTSCQCRACQQRLQQDQYPYYCQITGRSILVFVSPHQAALELARTGWDRVEGRCVWEAGRVGVLKYLGTEDHPASLGCSIQMRLDAIYTISNMLSSFPSSLLFLRIVDTKPTSDLQSQQASFSGKKQAGSFALPIFAPPPLET